MAHATPEASKDTSMSSLADPLRERARPGILFIDAFDSFTNNIVCLLSQVLDATVTVIHMNQPIKNLNELLSHYDAVVVGPGPGHPANPEDIGFIEKLWSLTQENMIPVLGICLGFQSLCHSQGAEIIKLKQARHGIVTKVSHQERDIFEGVQDLVATQYHSLKAGIEVGDSATVFYEPSEACPNLLPLAWDDDDEINGPILMGVRHMKKPFWGVQFHPESICTSPAGQELIKNWWKHASQWLQSEGIRRIEPTFPTSPSNDECLLTARVVNDQSEIVMLNSNEGSRGLNEKLGPLTAGEDVSLCWTCIEAYGLTPTEIVEALGQTGQEIILLDSQGHKSGQHSIIGFVVPGKTIKVTYRVSAKKLRFSMEGVDHSIPVDSIDEVWPVLQQFLDEREPKDTRVIKGDFTNGIESNGNRDFPHASPFWGGLMGYISYEAGLDTIDVEQHSSCVSGGVPDINFAFIRRSIVFDHVSSQIYVQSLRYDDDEWINNTKRLIQQLGSHAQPQQEMPREPSGKRQKTEDVHSSVTNGLSESAALTDTLFKADIHRPAEKDYRKKVLRCQEFLASGDSYELCLTDETQIKIPRDEGGNGVNEWALYKRLRQNNPAPFGAYLNLSGVTVVGSSPERFLRWTRGGRCQFRPIKGTVKKGPDMTREKAHEILGSSKERAENLMIVDLIRHDLSGVVGPESTTVPKLMVVEEYETVYQLVSVIEGQLPERGPQEPRGLDVLMRSLPPGSMTGAPKKRSCEILRDLEQRPRGVYSGVLGYMDVGGAGDFSVVIRTAMRNINEGQSIESQTTNGNGRHGIHDESAKDEIWRVGAGGAVTIQSTDEGEFQEMEAKQSSVLGSLLRQKK